MSDQRNLVIAIVLSVVILFGFQYFFSPTPTPPDPQQAQTTQQGGDSKTPSLPQVPGNDAPKLARSVAEQRVEALSEAPRVPIDAKRLTGSVNLRGARIDDVVLRDYKQTVEPGSPPVSLLSPAGSANAYYAEFGWLPAGKVKVPDTNTIWTAEQRKLTDTQPLILRWDNGEGLVFKRTITVDAAFLFTVTQEVENTGDTPVSLHPYGLVSRSGTPKTDGFYILHEGPLGVLGGTLVDTDVDYSDLQETPKRDYKSTGGWIGITDKYWLAALVPDQGMSLTGTFEYWNSNNTDRYQTSYISDSLITVEPGTTASTTNRLFAGAKEVHLLDRYEEQYGITHLDKAVDFGWFYYLTKPMFFVLDFFFKLLGNFGLAILLFTVCVKALFFPLANKSYKAMSKMKALTPKMTELREKYSDDRQKLNQEMMDLYRKEKVNPASGCLPILIQIPVFFCLYKVLYVTIEMRHQPFFGWIHDLSAPDPTNLFTLFGLIPWDQPAWLPILGIWPLLMGASMYMQQLLNPQPPDPVQAKVFLFMPLMFTVLLANFPAGLVIYWTWNNILSVTQQWVIMKRMGVPIGGGLIKPKPKAN